MKKTWIKIKRGLLEPKHREMLGIRIWLYIYILDNADWDTGEIREWRDKDAADELQMPWRTLQRQRQQLENDGYISCLQTGDKQSITIHNFGQSLQSPRYGYAKSRTPRYGGYQRGYARGYARG